VKHRNDIVAVTLAGNELISSGSFQEPGDIALAHLPAVFRAHWRALSLCENGQSDLRHGVFAEGEVGWPF